MALTRKQQWFLDYLKKKAGYHVSPSEIGQAYRRADNSSRSWFTTSDYSSFGSPVCKALVAKGLAVRNNKGHYMYSGAACEVKPEPIQVKKVSPGNTGCTGPIGKSSIGKTDPDAARLAYNKANGFIRVAVLSNGQEVYKKKNSDGKTWSYYSQRGQIFSSIWNEMLATEEEFLAVAKDCYKIGDIIVTDVKPVKPGAKYNKGQLVFYMKHGRIHSATVQNITGTPLGVLYTTVHGTIPEPDVYPTRDALVDSL